MSTILDVLRKAEGNGRGGRRSRASIEPPRDPLAPRGPKRRLPMILGVVAVLVAAFALGLNLSNRDATPDEQAANTAANSGEDATEQASTSSAPQSRDATVASAPAPPPERRRAAPVPAVVPPVAQPGAAAPAANAPATTEPVPDSGRTAIARNAPAVAPQQIPPTHLEQRLEPSKPPRMRARRTEGADRAAAIAARQERMQERRRERRERLAAARGEAPRPLAARPERPGAAGAGPAPPPVAAAPEADPEAAPPADEPAVASVPERDLPGAPEPPREMLASVTRQPPNGVPAVAINIVQWSASPERRFAFVTVDGGGMTQVREGDEISGLTVKRIYQEVIEFGHNGASFLLRAN